MRLKNQALRLSDIFDAGWAALAHAIHTCGDDRAALKSGIFAISSRMTDLRRLENLIQM